MLFLSNEILLLPVALLISIYILFTSTVYTYSTTALFRLPFVTFNFFKKLLLVTNDTLYVWAPLFKRSSYIGLVWKSNWKL